MAKSDRNPGWPGVFCAFTVLCAIALLLAQSGQGEALKLNTPGHLQVLLVYEGLTSWTVPALFMLWGMEGLGEGKPSLRHSTMGLLLPAWTRLVFWGAVFALLPLALGGGGLSLKGVWEALVWAAKGNTRSHLWVLYPLMGIYLVHPVLHRFAASASRWELRWFLGLSFLFASVLPLWTAFRPDSVAAHLLEQLRVHLVLGWVGCYVAGWYLRRHTIGRAPEFLIYILGILGVVFTLLGDAFLGGGRDLWYLYTSPNVILTAVAFCTLFRYVLGISEERSRRRSVHRVGEYAMGIYLIHPLWILLLEKLGVNLLAFSPVVSVPFFAALLFFLSLPVVWLLDKIPVVGEWLV